MNQGQEQFFNFILERVQDGKQEEAKELLNECFKKQAEGTFDAAFLQDATPKIIAVLKPENVEEVSSIMKEFGSHHVSR